MAPKKDILQVSDELKPFLVTKPVFYSSLCKENGVLDHNTEVEVYIAAKRVKNPFTGEPAPLPVALKGPTGTAKTTFLYHCAHLRGVPILRVPGHEGLSADDLIGFYRLEGGESKWVPGMAYLATKFGPGGTLYLDEVVEARPDVITVINPLTDWERELHVPAKNEHINGQPQFSVDMSYNPGYQSVRKDLKMSLRQRCVFIPLVYATKTDDEIEILQRIMDGNAGSDGGLEVKLKPRKIEKAEVKAVAELARRIRSLATGPTSELREGPSPRLELYALQLMLEGINPRDACLVSLCYPLSDKPSTVESMQKLVRQVF